MKTTIATLISIVMFGACTSDKPADYNPQLPPITQTGAYTFGCKINDIIMIPQDAKIGGNPGGSLPQGLTLSNLTDALGIEAIDAQYDRGSIIIKIPNTYTIGEYSFQSIEGGFSLVGMPNVLYIQATKNGKFYGSIENTGKINISKNDNTILSGTFYCKLKNRDNANDIIEVTEGRFDIKK